MWLGPASIHGVLLVFFAVFLRKVFTSAVEQTTALTNGSSTVITSPFSHVHFHSTVASDGLLNTQPSEFKNTSYSNKESTPSDHSSVLEEIRDVMMNSPASSHYTESFPGDSTLKEGKIASLEFANNSPSSAYLAESIKSKMIIASTLVVPESTAGYYKNNKNFTSIMVAQKPSSMILGSLSPTPAVVSNASQTKLEATALQESMKLNLIVSNFVANEKVSVYISSQSRMHSKMISAKVNPQINFITTFLLSELEKTNKSSVLKPSPTLTKNQHLNFTSYSLVNMTHNLSRKISEQFRTYDTIVKHITKSSALFTVVQNANMSTQIEVRNDNLTAMKPAISAVKQRKLSTSHFKVKLVNKTLSSSTTRKLDIFSSEMYPKMSQNIRNRTRPISKLTTSKISDNQTQTTDIFTSYPLIPLFSSPSSADKGMTSPKEALDSMTVLTKPPQTYTSFSKTFEMSDTVLEMMPTSTVFFPSSVKGYNTLVPTRPTSSGIRKQQSFSVKLKIISEEFKSEYRSGEAFEKKSKEIRLQFNHVFRHMDEYLYTEVLSFFKGSLGCDVIIHTLAAESDGVSAEEIHNTIEKASNTTGIFGKFVVDDIEVKEKKGEEKEDDDEKETWGRLPVIVISILGGVCLVLLVLVISQCVSIQNLFRL